jgi:hypothetical protein
MKLDNFDVVVNLVSLGLGVSLVPHRVLVLSGAEPQPSSIDFAGDELL